MSEININYTVPKEILGGQEVQRSDHGPFYFFSPAIPIYRFDYKDSVIRILPCEVTVCTDWAERLPEEQVPPGGAIQWDVVRDQIGNAIRFGTCIKPADKIANLINEMYGEQGVVEINAFKHLTTSQIELPVFNHILYSVRVEPGALLDPSLGDLVKEKGGLFVRKQLVQNGGEFIASVDFAQQFGSEKQSLYLNAAQECLDSFHRATQYVNRVLNESDAEVRLRLAGSGGKPTYDSRDSYFQWLLARKPIMEQAEVKQSPVQITLPEGFAQGQGITPEQLEAILTRVVQGYPREVGANAVEVEPGVVDIYENPIKKRGPGRPPKSVQAAQE